MAAYICFVIGVLLFTATSETLAAPSNDSNARAFNPASNDASSSDYSVCNDLMNTDNPPALDEIPWFCLCSTCQGIPGPTGQKGNTGTRGPAGPPGTAGMKGQKGAQGLRGLRGLEGLKGQKGDSGLKGNDGVTGPPGLKGDQGIKGQKGENGTSGAPGVQGPPGTPGQCAPCVGQKGDRGEQGITGPPGPQGITGLSGNKGETGLKGDKGDLGPAGGLGPIGPKGDQGPQGVCNCKDGSKGEPGQVGTAGSQGPKGAIGPQGIQGQKGDKGDMGQKGAEGSMGVPGPCTPAVQSAFSVALSGIYPKPNAPIPFNKTLYNDQGHFNLDTFIYTAPVAGAYAFTYQFTVYRKYLIAGLFRNSKLVVKSTDNEELDQLSQFVILQLDAGDKIWMQVKDINNNGAYVDINTDSTFSGFLIFPFSCDDIAPREFNNPSPTNFHWPGEDAPTTTQPSNW
ncbi:complement C1q and tumor necrosis factor-related protein 9-like [Protopterus annectens]|uniref:complement C1q and tumor necrosis factor-related protein 9-like n=1 Tax=Protopterus annectens TaxID=7888 RepID=UPI001CF94EDF|nr:complement C1q and tumor necrosis factor-related protein 9-like [Protopterus annectens]